MLDRVDHPGELEAQDAHRWHREAVMAAHQGRCAAWRLARALYEVHERALWRALGYSSVSEWLSDPDLEVGPRQAMRLIEAWRELVVKRQVDPGDLEEIPPTRAREVLPAVREGRVPVEQALADAKQLSRRDLAKLYRQQDRNEPVRAETEPELVRCPRCGSWVEQTQLAHG